MTDTSDRFSERLREIERRLAALEQAADATPVDAAAAPHRPAALPQPLQAEAPAPAPAADPRFWVLDRLRADSAGTAGAVVYAGVAHLPDGATLQWQIGRPTEQLLAEPWEAWAPVLAALGHPVRLALLQAMLNGAHTVQALQALPALGTVGQLYHHLKDLEAAGWVRSAQRGRYSVPAERVVPLLAVLSAAQG